MTNVGVQCTTAYLPSIASESAQRLVEESKRVRVRQDTMGGRLAVVEAIPVGAVRTMATETALVEAMMGDV